MTVALYDAPGPRARRRALIGAVVGAVVLAVVVAVSLARGGTPRWAVPALAAATVAAWAVRAPVILLGDHGAAFKVVHVGLALVSVALAVAAWRAVVDRQPARV